MGFSLIGMFSNDVGIDLGTANTLIYVRGIGIVLNEPSIVALNRVTKKAQAVGIDAKEMLGRTPGEIETVRPLRDGVIADFEVTEEMLRAFIKRVQRNRLLVRPRIVICVPSGITEVETRAVRDSAQAAGAREVYLIQEPMAAAIGVGLPFEEPIGSMVIDIGGGTSEIAVISLSGIVEHVSIRVGGDEMTDAITRHLKRNYNLLIGERTAEQIKCEVGSAFPLPEELEADVRGRDLVSALPKTTTVRSEEIREALNEPVAAIVHAVRQTLEGTPPELAADILDRGIVISGGGSALRGLDRRIHQETNLPVHVIDEPMTAVVKGTGLVLEDIDGYAKVLL
jgi:rod shape-determining protein MreB